jgi:hypothetical protein
VAGAAGAIPARLTALAGWERARGGPGVPWLDFWPCLGLMRGRRGDPTAQPCGGRLKLGSGEVSAPTGQEVAAQAPLGPRVGIGAVGRSWLQE